MLPTTCSVCGEGWANHGWSCAPKPKIVWPELAWNVGDRWKNGNTVLFIIMVKGELYGLIEGTPYAHPATHFYADSGWEKL